jgi:Sortilin, neurotensin receptor 3,/Sortilin, neurotensin receptor 3, C-terminal
MCTQQQHSSDTQLQLHFRPVTYTDKDKGKDTDTDTKRHTHMQTHTHATYCISFLTHSISLSLCLPPLSLSVSPFQRAYSPCCYYRCVAVHTVGYLLKRFIPYSLTTCCFFSTACVRVRLVCICYCHTTKSTSLLPSLQTKSKRYLISTATIMNSRLASVLVVVASLGVVLLSAGSSSSLAQHITDSGPVQHTKHLIDSPLEDIQWADSQTVFIVTELGRLYRSNDGGKAWTNQATKLHGSSANPVVRSIHISKADPRKIFFLGHGEENWITEDMGKSYTPTAELDVHEVRLHSRQSKWLLAGSMSPGCNAEQKRNCYKTMYMSKDFGHSWALVQNYAVQFDWAPSGPTTTKTRKTPLHADVFKNPYKDPAPTQADDTVYATVHSVHQGNQKFGMWDKDIHFYASHDYFKTNKMMVAHGNRFLFGQHNYLFVAAVNPVQESEVSLMVSSEEGLDKKFIAALLPVDLTEHSYTILDTSEGSVFLHVNHAPFEAQAQTGHVYISDWSGTRYSLSLPYNHRSGDGKCDFEKVEGLEGIYLANFIDEDEDDSNVEGWDNANNQQRNRHLKAKTVITFDKGGIWSYLLAPETDANGKRMECGENCHLHLHGITNFYGPFYSASTATGLIMSTGTVGRYLQESLDQINTYLSRDAGLTWYEVVKGSHIYEFGDHGGLIVMAYDEGETDSVLYTWDQGLNWKKLVISEKPLQVENIIIEPEATSQQFVVYGWQDDSGVLIHLDFAELHQRTCHGHDAPDGASSDYETWSPSDGRLGGKCLLGHKVTYTRRKRASQCFNPEQFEKAVMHEHCACTEEDFECDYGYMRKMHGGPCVKDPDAPPEPKKECKDFYYETKGYRRVAGDSCVGGDKWDRIRVPCPGWLGGSGTGKAVLLVLVAVVLLLAFLTFYSKSEFVEDLVDSIKARFNWDYNPVGKGMPETMDDDFFDDHEIHESASLLSSRASPLDDSDDHMLAPLPDRGTRQRDVPLLSKPNEDV